MALFKEEKTSMFRPNKTVNVPRMINTMKSTEKGLMFRLWWQERPWQSLRLCLSPEFYFYKLFHDILPYQTHERSLTDVIEQLESCLEDMDFDLAMKDEDKEGYSSLYEKCDVSVDMSKFFDICNIHQNQQPSRYQGDMNIEITITEPNMLETDVTFYSHDLDFHHPDIKDWSHHLNHVTLDRIHFQ